MGKHSWSSRESDANKVRAEQLKKNKALKGKAVEDHPSHRRAKKTAFSWFKKGS